MDKGPILTETMILESKVLQATGLLASAKSEILELRGANERAGIRLQAIDDMLLLARSAPPKGPGQHMTEDVVFQINRFFKETDNASNSKP